MSITGIVSPRLELSSGDLCRVEGRAGFDNNIQPFVCAAEKTRRKAMKHRCLVVCDCSHGGRMQAVSALVQRVALG